MDKQEVIATVKKNAVAIGIGVVALVAVGATFYPLGGQQQELRDDADKHGALATDLNALKNKTFPPPQLDPFNTASGKLTASFPVPDVTNALKKAMAELDADSRQMFDAVVAANNHTNSVMMKHLLPAPSSESPGLAFGARYLKILETKDPTITGKIAADGSRDKDLNDSDTPATQLNLNLYNDVLHGGIPPTIDEIKRAAYDMFNNKYKVRFQYQGDEIINQEKIMGEYHKAEALLPEQMKLAVAKNHKMYVDTDALVGNSDIGIDTSKTTPDAFWYAQQSLWVQQDLCAGLAKANEDKTDIRDARVKRVISIRTPSAAPSSNEQYYLVSLASAAQAGGGGGGGGGGMIGDTSPKPAAATETGKLVPDFSRNPTGRTSNGMYDVVQFTMTIDVDLTQVKEVIKDLSDDKLITITNMSLYVIDPTTERAHGFIYGNATVVRLQLEGEALYMRAWTSKLMPEPVKTHLGIPAENQNGQNNGNGNGNGGGGGGGGMGRGMGR